MPMGLTNASATFQWSVKGAVMAHLHGLSGSVHFEDHLSTLSEMKKVRPLPVQRSATEVRAFQGLCENQSFAQQPIPLVKEQVRISRFSGLQMAKRRLTFCGTISVPNSS